MAIPNARTHGFATVLFVLVLVGFLTALLLYKSLGVISKKSQAGQANTATFRKVDDALAQFAMLYKRLPCPASGTTHTGLEDFAGFSTSNLAAGSSTCNSPAGVVPWAVLGLTQTDALDSWGRYIAYRVFSGAIGYTQTNGFALPDCLDETVSTTYSLSGLLLPNNLIVCNTNTHENTYSDYVAATGITVNDMGNAKVAAYALISMGETGLGAFYPGATTSLSMPSSSSKEYLNAQSGGAYWITAPSDSSIAADSAAHFDDVISYTTGTDLVYNAKLRPGTAWKLAQVFTQNTLGLTSGYNTQTGSMKVAAATLVGSTFQGPVMVTASADTTSRVICATSTSPQGVAPCVTSITNGNDLLSTSDDESLTFDFRVTRKKLVIQLTDFRQSGSDQERAQITLLNGATQVYQAIATSTCNTGGTRLGEYTIDISASGKTFTKVVVKALTTTNTAAPSDFGVAAILACKTVDATCAYSGWTTATCSATL